MDIEEILRELDTLERIIEVRKYRFRKDMHELERDRRELKKELEEKTSETSKVTAEEGKKAKASSGE